MQASLLTAVLFLTGTFLEAAEPPATPEWLSKEAIDATRKAVRARLNKLVKNPPPTIKVDTTKPYNFWVCGRKAKAADGDRQKLAALLIQHLLIADQLANADTVDVRRTSLGVARLCIVSARFDFKDEELGAAICDGWLMPRLEFCDPRPDMHLSKIHMLATAIAVYSPANQPHKLQHAAEIGLSVESDLNAADAYRFIIARALQKQKKPEEAIKVLEQISYPTMLVAAKEMIEKLKQPPPAPKKP